MGRIPESGGTATPTDQTLRDLIDSGELQKLSLADIGPTLHLLAVSIEQLRARLDYAEERTDRRVDSIACQGCDDSDEEWHDELIRLFLNSPIAAVNLVLEDADGPDLEQAAHFIAAHRWPDQVVMANLAHWLRWHDGIESGGSERCVARRHE